MNSTWSQVLSISFLLGVVICDGQVTSNVLFRTRLIVAGNSSGTAFTLDVDGRQYLVTAKHVVTGLKPEDFIHIYKEDRLVPMSVKVFRCADPIDIAILIPPAQESVDYPLPTPDKDSHFFMGQDAYIVGYPYGLSSGGRGTRDRCRFHS